MLAKHVHEKWHAAIRCCLFLFLSQRLGLFVAGFLSTYSITPCGRSNSFVLEHASSASETPPESTPPIFDFEAGRTVDFKFHSTISSIDEKDWNECLGATGAAFLDHSWLRCLEESNCVSNETGWVPTHVSISIHGETIGYVPLYLKSHGMGEFIFDNHWAEMAGANGIQYYPKMLVAVPFTPVTGRRILWKQRMYESYTEQEVADMHRAVAMFLRKTAERSNISSVHINFMTEEEATNIGGNLDDDGLDNDVRGREHGNRKPTLRPQAKDDYIRRTSVQYHWRNFNHLSRKPFVSFEDYLGSFRSKRRINIRRERQKVLEDEGIIIDAIRGREILRHEGLTERMFEIYKSTIDKMYFGRQYLNLEFFKLLAESEFVDHLCFMCVRYDEANNDEFCAADVFAGTFNVVKDGVFYGRYWGSLAEKEVKNLHFETCYWSAIEYCIAQGIKRMEPGAGGGDYKWARGFDPALIHSVHYIFDPDLRKAIAQYVEYETEDNLGVADYLLSRRKRGD